MEVMLIFRWGVSQPVARLEWTLASRVLAVRIDALTHLESQACARCFTTSRDAESICFSYRDFGQSRLGRRSMCRILFGWCGQLIACSYRAIGKQACGRPARPQDRGMRRFLVAETAG
jgi:hypothetical protein